MVLDRPTITTVRQAWRGGVGLRSDDEFVYSGGPVSGPLIALHTDPLLGEIEVLPGVFYSVQKRRLKELFDAERHPLKLFYSHIGWGQGQLSDSWRTTLGESCLRPPSMSFPVGTNLWEEVSKLADDPS